VSDRPPALTLRALAKTYPPRGGARAGDQPVVALDGIDLTVPHGAFYALLGPNGAGKSTTLGILAGLVRKSSGSAKVYGYDMDRQPGAARAQLGLVPQEFNFNTWEPVQEIIRNQGGFFGVPPQLARQRTDALLHRLGLWDKRREQARTLSGGMKRRLMIARALVHAPRLLILDEPTAGVDIELRRSMWAFLRELNQDGTTIILTTHYLEEAEQLCREIAIIDHGRIVTDTTVKALLQQLPDETFVIDLVDPLHELPHLPDYPLVRVDAHTVEVRVRRDAGLNGLFRALEQAGLQVQSLRNKENRLEALFLKLTGTHV